MRWNDWVLIVSGLIMGAILVSTIMAVTMLSHDYHVQWDSVLTAISTAVLALLTAVLAYYTAQLYAESKQKRQDDAAPNVIVSIEQAAHWGFYDLVIENCGHGIAYNIEITPENNFKTNGIGAADYSDRSFYHISLLKPGQRLSSFFASSDGINDISHINWSVTFSNQPSGGDLFKNSFGINLEVFQEMTRLGGDAPYRSRTG